ncbi:hypothetical protein HPB48_010667 [Haemaphysalis longicornis]|uniref:Uncharacterized protein n=1 Tax=Haemaphysalis longicornis TaxID=44386 RepID=A0A9J6G507_HAELO|nr:hypothetical protein HPB48_010667 [Haemaphysalis longicornis]
MVNQSGCLTLSEKFNYLLLFLKGAAASAVSDLQNPEACYKDAIGILKRPFGDKTRLEHEYFATLRMLNPIKTSSDTVELRKLYYYVLVNIRGIETLGLKKSSFSSMLCDILLRALPHDIVVQYHCTCAAQVTAQRTDASQEETDVDRLLPFFGIELASLEKSNFKTSNCQKHIPGHIEGKGFYFCDHKTHRPYCTTTPTRWPSAAPFVSRCNT